MIRCLPGSPTRAGAAWLAAVLDGRWLIGARYDWAARGAFALATTP